MNSFVSIIVFPKTETKRKKHVSYCSNAHQSCRASFKGIVALLPYTGVGYRPIFRSVRFPFSSSAHSLPFCNTKEKEIECEKESTFHSFTDLGSLTESLEKGPLQGEMELRTNCGLKLYHMMPLPISMNNQKLNDLDRTVASNCPDRRLKTSSLPQPLEVCSVLPLPALHPLKYW